MGKIRKGHVGLLIVLAGIGAAILAYYLLRQPEQKPEETVHKTRAEGEKTTTPEGAQPAPSGEEGAVDISAEKETAPSGEVHDLRAFPIKKKQEGPDDMKDMPGDVSGDTAKEEVLKIEVGADMDPRATVTQNYCSLIDDHVHDFFAYLDHQPYVKALNLEHNTFTCFQEILDRLAAHPPLPAGEGVHPAAILKNMYHLYRVLNLNDMWLIKAVLEHEQDNLEINLDIFYKWLVSGDRCSKSRVPRPPLDVTYQYAGFFLNTIGGRAYLFRRSPTLRLLIGYYAILIVHRADTLGKDTYGIDLLPRITILKEEISNTTLLEYQMNYVDQLTQLEDYYLKKR